MNNLECFARWKLLSRRRGKQTKSARPQSSLSLSLLRGLESSGRGVEMLVRPEKRRGWRGKRGKRVKKSLGGLKGERERERGVPFSPSAPLFPWRERAPARFRSSVAARIVSNRWNRVESIERERVVRGRGMELASEWSNARSDGRRWGDHRCAGSHLLDPGRFSRAHLCLAPCRRVIRCSRECERFLGGREHLNNTRLGRLEVSLENVCVCVSGVDYDYHVNVSVFNTVNHAQSHRGWILYRVNIEYCEGISR